MQVENYKLQNLLKAVMPIKQNQNLAYGTVFAIAKLIKFGEEALKPSNELTTSLQKEYPAMKDEDGKVIMVAVGPGQSRPQFQNEEEYFKKLTDLANEKTDFIMNRFEISIKKNETRLSVDLVSAFMAVFGDEFVVNEIE